MGFIGLIIAAAIAFAAWRKVNKDGNYETVYGVLMMYTLPLYLIGYAVFKWIL